MPGLAVEWHGCVPYAEATGLQEAALAARRAGHSGDRLLLLEHPPVVTLGRATRSEHLLESRESLARRGVEVHEAARGGDVTYHGPGQLVGYLVCGLAGRGGDVHRLLRAIEGALSDALRALGIAPRRVAGRTGVFVAAPGPARKIASIGLGLRHGVTWHGFALNVSVDLDAFGSIVPCGLRDVAMTSVLREVPGLGPQADDRARDAVRVAFEALA